MALDRRQIAEFDRDLGAGLVLVVGDDERAPNGLIQVGVALLCPIRTREFLQRPDDRGDPADAVHRARQCKRRILDDVIQIGVSRSRLGACRRLSECRRLGECRCLGDPVRRANRLQQPAVRPHHGNEVGHAGQQEL